MTIKELISRSLNGEQLTPAEKAELAAFDPETLTAELNHTKSQLELLENEKLSHSEKLQKELDSLRSAHSTLETEHQELKRRCRIEKLTGEIGCSDADYFDFLARRANLDLDDSAAVREFSAKLSETSPGCFRARITPGSSAGTAQDDMFHHRQHSSFADSGSQVDRIMDSLAAAALVND
ncbi:MAG: hypothetical protein IJY46_08875 [Lentisphaeria bacterium]|nr:hypothetical protein [Lentisphaeria bacterium]